MRRRYDTDGVGRWWCTEWASQCDYNVLLGGRCQGTRGHGGDHWSYQEDGTYQYRTPGGGGGWIPPGHKDWITPVDKAHELYRAFYTDFEVTDPGLIARLEAGDVDDPITAPCTDEEIEELKRLGRLPEGDIDGDA